VKTLRNLRVGGFQGGVSRENTPTNKTSIKGKRSLEIKEGKRQGKTGLLRHTPKVLSERR